MTKAPTHTTQKTIPQRRHRRIITALLLLFIFTNIGYLGYAHHQLQISTQHQQVNWQILLQQSQQSLDKATQKINTLQEAMETQQKNLQEQIDNLQKQVHACINDSTHAEQAWLIQKAIYYLQMAQISNRWDKDHQAAARWLNESLSLLKSHPTNDSTPIQQKIAALQTNLSAMPNQNTALILDKISNLQKALDGLFGDIVDNAQLKPAKSDCDMTSKQSNNTSWQEYKNNVSCLFQKIIIIHRPYDKNMDMLSPLYQRTMQEKIALELAQVQWAFLQNNAHLYQRNLQQIRKDVLEKFNPENAHIQTVLDSIESLQAVSFNSIQINVAPLITELQKILDHIEPASQG